MRKVDPTKFATAYVSQNNGIYIQLPSGQHIPGLRCVEIQDHFEELTTCTATFIVNLGKEPLPVTTEAERITDLVKKIASSEADRGRALQQLVDTQTKLYVEQENRKQIEKTWWYRLFGM